MSVPHTSGLLAGVGRADITPPPDCTLAGFAARDHRAEGIHDDLTATALALRGGRNTVVIVALDLVSISDEHLEYIRSSLARSHGLAPRQILVNCSHSHSGPVTGISDFDLSFSGLCPYRGDPDYLDSMKKRVLKAITAALDSMAPAEAFWGLGETHIGISRRSPDTSIYKGPASGDFGIFSNYPNPGMEIDHACPVLLVKNAKGAPLALLFGAPCHPTTMSFDNYLVSAEYPGEARRALEKDLGGAPAMFVQGIGGDVKPRQVALETKFRSGSFDDVAAVGRELASDVTRIMGTGLEPLTILPRSSIARVPVPLASGWDEAAYRRLADGHEPEHRKYWARWWLGKIAKGEKLPTTVDITLALMEIAPGLRLAGVSGELLTGMGLKIKRRFRSGTTLPLGYTNGVVAYVPDSDVLDEGGYEAIESIFFDEVMAAPWRRDIDDTVLGVFDGLEKELA